jgi:alkylated DNA repair protein (DNA oxidative demethylase)
MNLPVEGARLLPGYFDPEARRALLADVLARAEAAPFYTATMPRSGAPLSTRTTNLGPLGWVTDIAGYRYQAEHPHTGAAWPAMPQVLLDLWRDVAGYPAPPEACLVNWYGPASRLGLHVDQDEEAVNAPVVSVSLGDDALFRLGGQSRRDPTRSFRLRSGDVVVLAGPSRRCFHGVDRIYPGTSQLVPGGGRINLTMRRVHWPAADPEERTA